MIKLCIFGSRNLHPTIGEIDEVSIPFAKSQWGNDDLPDSLICGMAGGADTAGRKWALHHNITIDSFYAEWGKHGKVAGHIRNEIMAKQCTHAIGFWDGSSGGTANMVAHLVHLRKPLLLVKMASNQEIDDAAYSIYDKETLDVCKTQPSIKLSGMAGNIIVEPDKPGLHDKPWAGWPRKLKP